ncbi:hypothetical protein PZF67_006308 [Pseudomonas aeruginosa]|uniref:hypothetical protein n=1 Tax=Pseudomonas aeruginosa TaxID=287 RepID=UPI0025CACABB|nr:hypothetical protein [Pseudomonas aeruginosa]
MLYSVWNTYRHTRVIPVLLAAAVLGALFVTFAAGGVMAIASGNGLGSLLVGVIGLIFGLGVLQVWWRVVSELLSMKVDNTWTVVVIVSILVISLYVENGPGGRYVGRVIAEAPIFLIKVMNPSLDFTWVKSVANDIPEPQDEVER